MEVLLSVIKRISIHKISMINFLERINKKGSKGILKSSWSHRMGIFWKIHFITTSIGQRLC